MLAWQWRGVAPQSSAIIVMENFSRKDFAVGGESYRRYLRPYRLSLHRIENKFPKGWTAKLDQGRQILRKRVSQVYKNCITIGGIEFEYERLKIYPETE